jgi:hypothetical protein
LKNCWNCFGKCKRGGNVIDFVSLKEGIGFREAALRIQEWFGLESKTPAKATSKMEETNPTELVVVVEGFFDCMKTWHAGLRAVSIMGSSLSETQASRLCSSWAVKGEYFSFSTKMTPVGRRGQSPGPTRASRLRESAAMWSRGNAAGSALGGTTEATHQLRGAIVKCCKAHRNEHQERHASMTNALALLDRLKADMPEIWDQAEVVGMWVWLEFARPPLREIRAKLRDLGLHWNSERRPWQHPCGVPCGRSRGDPRGRYELG